MAPIRIVVVAAILAAAGAAHAQPSFHPLGFLTADGFGPCIAFGVSADGKVVVGESNSDAGGAFEAFRWTLADGMVGLGDLPGGYYSSMAYAVSADGSVIAGAADDGKAGEEGAAFIWTKAGGMKSIGSLGGPTTYGQGQGMSADGSVIVGASQSPSGIEAYRWTEATGMVNIGDLDGGAVWARASAVTADGALIVGTGSTDSFGFDVAFRWTEAKGMEALPSGSARTAGLGVSADGSVIVGQVNGRPGYYTDATGWVNLGFLVFGASIGYANACSADGSVIVGLTDYNASEGTGEAFIWDKAHGMRSLTRVLRVDYGLDLQGMSLFDSRDISADGLTLVGYGFNRRGEQEGWMADLHSGACRADCNKDGLLNINDFICFQSEWRKKSAYGDYNGDGVWNVNDFIAFQADWRKGC